MGRILTADEKLLFNKVPNTASIGNVSLREGLGWSKAKYFEVRAPLIRDGFLRVGGGKGGSVARQATDEQTLLQAVPTDGRAIGNITLRAALGWEEAKYWRTRNDLVQTGLLIVGGGKGGSVRRSLDLEEEAEDVEEEELVNPDAPVGQPYSRESDLYEPIATVLRGAWAANSQLSRFEVEVTAYQGRRKTGGRWTRPDLTVASQRVFELSGLKLFDAHTFEVKLGGTWDVAAIYEAAAHRRSATQSYAFFHSYEPPNAKDELLLDVCAREARRLGVGLIVSAKPDNFGSWDLREAPVRHEPRPEDLEALVGKQFSTEAIARIRGWW